MRGWQQPFLPLPPTPHSDPYSFNKWVDCHIILTSQIKNHIQLLFSLFPCFLKEHLHTLFLIFTSCQVAQVLFFLRDRGSQCSASDLVELWTRIQLHNLGDLCTTKLKYLPTSYNLLWQLQPSEGSQKQREQLLFLTYSVIRHRCQILDKQMSYLDGEKSRATQTGWITAVVNEASKKCIWGYIQKSLHFTVTERPLASPKRSRWDRQINASPANESIYSFPMWGFFWVLDQPCKLSHAECTYLCKVWLVSASQRHLKGMLR